MVPLDKNAVLHKLWTDHPLQEAGVVSLLRNSKYGIRQTNTKIPMLVPRLFWKIQCMISPLSVQSRTQSKQACPGFEIVVSVDSAVYLACIKSLTARFVEKFTLKYAITIG